MTRVVLYRFAWIKQLRLLLRAKLLQLTADGKTRAAQMDAALIPFRRNLFAECEQADIDACLRVLSGLQSKFRPCEPNNGDKQA